MPASPVDISPTLNDETLFGWDTTPGIVSVWATRAGKALVWQRQGGQVMCTKASFRPWLFASTLEDLPQLPSQQQTTVPLEMDQSTVSYRPLEGSAGSYQYLLSARNGQILEQVLLSGASRRLGRRVASLGSYPYRLRFIEHPGAPFFRLEQVGGQKVLHINKAHRFYTNIYLGLDSTRRTRSAWKIVLFVIGECEVESDDERRRFYETERSEWSTRLRLALDHLNAHENVVDTLLAQEEI